MTYQVYTVYGAPSRITKRMIEVGNHRVADTVRGFNAATIDGMAELLCHCEDLLKQGHAVYVTDHAQERTGFTPTLTKEWFESKSDVVQG